VRGWVAFGGLLANAMLCQEFINNLQRFGHSLIASMNFTLQPFGLHTPQQNMINLIGPQLNVAIILNRAVDEKQEPFRWLAGLASPRSHYGKCIACSRFGSRIQKHGCGNSSSSYN
jgi:hypothetical protein